MALLVNKVECNDEVRMDMPKLVEEMEVVLVEIVDWTKRSTVKQRSDSVVDFQYKVPAVAH